MPSMEQNPLVTEKILKDTDSLRTGGLDHITDYNYRPTIIDLPGIGNRADKLSDQELLSWVASETGISKNLLNENGSSEKSKEAYVQLNKAYQSAKDFLFRTLKYTENESLKVGLKGKPDKKDDTIDSADDIIYLLRKTVSGGAKTGGLSQANKYCRVIKTTLAIYESTKNDAKKLKKVTEQAENSIISSSGESTLLTESGYHPDGSEFMVQDEDGSIIHGVFIIRAKEFGGVVLRFLNRPESNAETALGDGIGMRIVIDKNQIVKLIPILCDWLIKNMGVDNLNIENESYFKETKEDKERENNLNYKLLTKLPKNTFRFSKEEPNKTSSGNFEILKIKGNFNFSNKDETLTPIASSSVHARKFEIQFELPDSKNEEGENDHNLYDVKKFIAARTRLDGYCSESAFNEFVVSAADKSKKKPESFKHLLMGTNNPSVVETKKGGKTIYISFSVYERWKKLGFITDDYFQQIENAKTLGQKKYK